MKGPPVVKSYASTSRGIVCCNKRPSARAKLVNPRPSPRVVASASATGIPRHFPKSMVYPLFCLHKTLLDCLESSIEKRARAFLCADDTISPGPSQGTAVPWRHLSRQAADPIGIAPHSNAIMRRPMLTEARVRPRSVNEPCVSGSVRNVPHLEGIAGPGHKKETGLSLKSERPVQFPRQD
jgi:hypothetical protein